MITCYIRYEVEPTKLKEFERYAELWIPLVRKFGGQHHGYFLPHESANDLAIALFSFNSLADYEIYRDATKSDPECQAAFEFAEKTMCIKRYERQFLRPIGTE